MKCSFVVVPFSSVGATAAAIELGLTINAGRVAAGVVIVKVVIVVEEAMDVIEVDFIMLILGFEGEAGTDEGMSCCCCICKAPEVKEAELGLLPTEVATKEEEEGERGDKGIS